LDYAVCFGYGITTKALAPHLENVVFYDDNTTQPYKDANGWLICPAQDFNPQNSPLQIPSPGIPPHHPLIQKANNLISEYDYFANTQPLQVWVSGTNGKTTTTQMITHLLRDKGAVAGGNIGIPLVKLPQDAPLWIL
jgi:UDP-N-acetylmuramoylalanine--D-glutamate ligase